MVFASSILEFCRRLGPVGARESECSQQLDSKASLASLALLWICMTLGGIVSPLKLAASEFDHRDISRIRPGCAPVVWDCLTSEQWVCGRPLQHDQKLSQGKHVVLAPGEFIEFKILPKAMVRVASLRARLSPSDLRVWVSDGSCIYRNEITGEDEQSKSLVSVVDSNKVMLVRVQRPATANCSVCLKIFCSRHVELPFTDGYHCKLAGACCPVVVTSSSRFSKQDYNFVNEGADTTLKVTGPTTLRVQSRLLFSCNDTRRSVPYQVYARRNGVPDKILELRGVFPSRSQTTVNGQVKTVSTVDQAFLQIPAGIQQINLRPNADCYLRVTRCSLGLCQKQNWPCVPPQHPSFQEPNSIWQLQQPSFDALLLSNRNETARTPTICTAFYTRQPLPRWRIACFSIDACSGTISTGSKRNPTSRGATTKRTHQFFIVAS